MPKAETNRAKIIARLEREGWENVGGGKHDKFRNPGKPGRLIIVPRHKTLSPGVGRNIAKQAGWID